MNTLSFYTALPFIRIKILKQVIINKIKLIKNQHEENGAHYYFCFILSLLIESYLEYQNTLFNHYLAHNYSVYQFIPPLFLLFKKSVHVNIKYLFLLTSINSVF